MKPSTLIGTFLAIMLTGCVTTPSLRGHADLLDFLVDDQSSKEEVLLKFGQPSAKFQTERILTYRLGMEPKNRGYYLVTREMSPEGWPTWSSSKYSLVLVFDAQAVLRRHSLVEVN